ncbi:hypothetical protein M3193_11320 [Sporosarcina luteola]|nr:hypothetical protein [Sporosarcina luteola]MCM3744735.1 hypothetical protein [Sporosarcina luteola]
MFYNNIFSGSPNSNAADYLKDYIRKTEEVRLKWNSFNLTTAEWRELF